MDKTLLKALGLLFLLVLMMGGFLLYSMKSTENQIEETEQDCVTQIRKKYNISEEQFEQMKAQSQDGIIAVPPEVVEEFNKCVKDDASTMAPAPSTTKPITPPN